MALYSTSVKDLETQSCFLHLQEIKASPRKMHQPMVDFLVSGLPAQSASLYAVKLGVDCVGKKQPTSR
jgi:hypothetical protein